MNSTRHRRQWRCLIFLLVFLTYSEVTGEPNLNASPNETNSTQSSHGIKALAADSCNKERFKMTWRCGEEQNGYKYIYNEAFDQCIYRVSKKMTWFLAAANCEIHGGVLLTPAPPFENLEAGYNTIGSKSVYWIAYHDNKAEGCFVPHYDGYRACININSTRPHWYGEGPSIWNGYGNQDCLTIGYKDQPKLDDRECDEEKQSICQLQYYTKTTQSLDFENDKNVILLGDTFTLSFTYRFERYVDFQITIKNAREEMFQWTESPKRNNGREHYPVDSRYAAPGEHVNAREYYGFYKTDGSARFYGRKKAERCIGSKKFHIHLVAREANKKIAVRIDPTDDSAEFVRSFGVTMISGHHYPTLVPPTGEIFNFGTYEFKCFARLGSDMASGASIGIINRNYADVDRFVEDAMGGWSAKYSYSTKKLEKEEGIRPDNLDVDEVNRGNAYWASGHYVNVTFSIGPKVGRFHGRRVFCRSDTWYARQKYGQPKSDNFTSVDLKVTFLPTKPELTILWEGEPGKIVAGKQLRAKCEAFVGTLVDNPVFYWRTFSPVFKASTWKFNHFNGKIEHQHIFVSNLPERLNCTHNMQKNGDSKCIQFVRKTVLTLMEAYDYCKEQKHFRLLRINDFEDFEYYLGEVGDEGFLIDLNDMETEGVYKTLNGTIVDPMAFAYWYEPSKNDAPIREDPAKSDCVIIRKGGLQAIPCHIPMPFICESESGYNVGPNDQHLIEFSNPEIYDPEYGPKYTSIVTIDVKDNDWLDGGKLQCGTEKPTMNNKALEVMANYRISPVSEWSAEFYYIYEPLIPTIVNNSEYVMNSLIITLKCTSIVAMEGGAITWIMQQKDGVKRTWIVGFVFDAIIERNPHKRISITVEEDTKQSKRSRDSGRNIITTMTIDFKMPLQMSVVDCYSYNTELPWIENSTFYKPEQLKDSHMVDYKNIGINVTEDMLKSISVEASTESGDEGSSNAWYYMLALFILVGVAGTAFVANKKINNKDDAGHGANDQGTENKDENNDGANHQGAEMNNENNAGETEI